MNRFLKVFSLIAFITFFASCKNDDDVKVAPPRDYGVQYASDKDSIEKFLKNHYIDLNTETLDATFPAIADYAGGGAAPASIWDQTTYPLQNLKVTRNEVEYTLYYVSFREGVGQSPSMADNINFTYRGLLFDGTQFDYRENSVAESPLYQLVPGWLDVLPRFKSGVYVEGNEGDPAKFTDFGAGAMFLPSGLAYFNSVPSGSNLVSAYACMAFSFQLLDVTYTDIDGDGILNKDEVATPGGSPEFYDTDGDEIPNYLDTDDDNDGRLTKDELRVQGTVNEYYKYEDMFIDGVLKDEFKCAGGSLPKFLDPNCKGGL